MPENRQPLGDLPFAARKAVLDICADTGVAVEVLVGSAKLDKNARSVRKQCWLRLKDAFGLGPTVIAKAFGVSSGRVSQIIGPGWKQGLQIPVNDAAMDVLTARAKQRGMTPEDLAALLLHSICADDLFNAILDDEEAA